MGKIRTKTLGSEEEKEQKQKDKARREGKKLREKAIKEEEISKETLVEEKKETEVDKTPKPEKKKEKAVIQKLEGKKYRQVRTFVDRTKKYPISEAVKLTKKTSYTKFDGTIEVHINALEKGIRGTVTLPHGTGRQIKVAVASDDLIKEISAGKINFDILIATPDMMPKLAKVAKVLGPKGLMPNPKSGTISTEPEKLIEKLSHGQIQFKTENDAPIIHSVIGKVSFEENKLEENLKTLVNAIGKLKIKSMSINCTMGPGIKLDLNSI